MRRWLWSLARTFLPVRRPHRPVRRVSFLRVERLEDRSVPSTLSDEVTSAVYASLSSGVTIDAAGATVALAGGSVSTTGLHGPGLDRLISALRQLVPVQPPAVQVPPVSAPDNVVPDTPALGADAPGTLAPGGDTGPFPPKGGFPDSAGPGSVPVGTPQGGGAGSVGEEFVAVAAPQGGSDLVERIVPLATPDPARASPQAGQPTPLGGTLFGPGTLHVPPPAFSYSSGSPAAPGASPSVALEGGGVAYPQAAPPQGAAAATNPPGVPGADVLIYPGTRAADPSDWSLLQRYAASRDQSAFSILARRYESAVLRVCAEILGDPDRARDASQATFQALARRAGSLDGRAPLAGWLSTVASRLALRYRAGDARQRQLERAAAAGTAREVMDPAADIEREELRAVVGDELDRLPAKYRVPLVLHYLGGRTHEEVAREVGLPKGSIARRLQEALDLLRDRLVARGFPF